jgi:hypothetical protein
MSERDFVGYVRGTLNHLEERIRESKDYIVEEVARLERLQARVVVLVVELLAGDRESALGLELLALLPPEAQERVKRALDPLAGLGPLA